MAKKIVLAGACRTAIGTMGGALSSVPAVDLGAIVIKEALNKIAAFFFIRLGCKECGNFHAMAIQFFTGSEQFVLFLILMEILRFPSQIPVSSA